MLLRWRLYVGVRLVKRDIKRQEEDQEGNETVLRRLSLEQDGLDLSLLY